MRQFIASYRKSKNLHHACLFEGQRETTKEALFRFFLEDLSFSIDGNPDFSYREFVQFGIDDGRLLQQDASKKRFSGEYRVFVLALESMTREAQNALLKLFEEPTQGTHFFLIMPSAEELLPTLRSRLTIYRGDRLPQESSIVDAFLSCAAPERLTLIKPFIDEKDAVGARRFLSELERRLHASADLAGDTRATDAFKTIFQAQRYLQTTGGSLKMTLEHLCVALPVMEN